MATREELREALDDYVAQANANERVRRTMSAWTRVIHIQATDADPDADADADPDADADADPDADADAAFTMTVERGEVTALRDGLHGTPDLVISGRGEDLTDIFWCDANPASTYMQGTIRVQGSADDVMRLDAMAMFVYLAAGGTA